MSLCRRSFTSLFRHNSVGSPWPERGSRSLVFDRLESRDLLTGLIAGFGTLVDGKELIGASSPSISDAGEIAYFASYVENTQTTQGLFVEDQLVVEIGDVIDGDTVAGFAGTPSLNDGGEVVFVGQLSGSRAVYSIDVASGLGTRLIGTGDTIDGETLVGFGDVSANDAGDLLIWGSVADSPENRHTLLTKTSVIATAGDIVDGVVQEVFSNPSLNDNGDLFWGSFGSSAKTYFKNGQVVVAPGDVIDGKQLTDLISGELNNTGAFAIISYSTGAGRAIFTPDAMVLQIGDILDGHEIRQFNRVAINETRSVVFGATYKDASGTTHGGVFQIDPTPTITSISVPVDPVNINDQSSYTVDVLFRDPAGVDDEPYTCDFDMDGDLTSDITVTGVTGTSCSAILNYAQPGVYNVTVTVTDKDGESDSVTATEFIVIYEPTGGFVTGGGLFFSPEGACTFQDCTDDTTGTANFGFVSKYKNGASTPAGKTEFQFKSGDLKFHSTSYEWLVVAGPKAMFKGDGSINGTPGFSFQISAIDGQVNGGGGVDKFRIKIREAGGGVIYDNQRGAGNNDDPTTQLGGGSIKIHKPNSNGNSLTVNVVSAEQTIREALAQSTLDPVDLMTSHLAPGDSETPSREVPGKVHDTFWSEDDFLKSLSEAELDQGDVVEKELRDVIEELGNGYLDDAALEEALEL